LSKSKQALRFKQTDKGFKRVYFLVFNVYTWGSLDEDNEIMRRSIPSSINKVLRHLFCNVFQQHALLRPRFYTLMLYHFPGKLVSFCMLENVSRKPGSRKNKWTRRFQRDKIVILYPLNKQVFLWEGHAFFTFWHNVHKWLLHYITQNKYKQLHNNRNRT
jgi:hypothetical protein